jgi:hypothetical protein
MNRLNASIREIPQPSGVDKLPVDERGFPVPWFVYIDAAGKADHRVVGPGKLRLALREERCWLCGGKLGRVKASVIGPMCAVNRITSEPPCHPQCARYAVQSCPFLSKPRARRNEKGLPEEARTAAGIALDRNPGVTVIWESLMASKPFRPLQGAPGVLFDLGAPHRVTWWREGLPATREEALEALKTGLPALLEVAEQEGQAAIDALREAAEKARALLPSPARKVA